MIGEQEAWRESVGCAASDLQDAADNLETARAAFLRPAWVKPPSVAVVTRPLHSGPLAALVA
jgi:hypothetical protein